MKKHHLRVISAFIASTFLACAPVYDSPTQVPVVIEAPTTQEQATTPITIDHGSWRIELPRTWLYDDVMKQQGSAVGLLAATSTHPIGRGNVVVAVNSIVYQKDWTEEQFAKVVILKSTTMLPGSDLIDSSVVEVDNHPASVSIVRFPDSGAGMVLFAVPRNGTGYVVSCWGDAQGSAGKDVAAMCFAIIRSFHVQG